MDFSVRSGCVVVSFDVLGLLHSEQQQQHQQQEQHRHLHAICERTTNAVQQWRLEHGDAARQVEDVVVQVGPL